jgi:hypothetical protein
MAGQIVLTASSAGTVTLTPANTGNTFVATVPARTGNIAVDGPAFSAYIASTQTIAAATWVKLSFDTKTFDTNTNFDTSTKRFTPTVAGYYQINGTIQPLGSNINAYIAAYKNGTINQYGTFSGASTASNPIISISTLIYCNGSTDYIELYVNSSGTTVSGGSAGSISNFSGFMARAT